MYPRFEPSFMLTLTRGLWYQTKQDGPACHTVS